MINKVGIQTFTIRKQIQTSQGLEDTFRLYAKKGIKRFELSRLNFSKEEMVVLKKLKVELGLDYTACQIPLRKIIKDFDFLMDFCNTLDIKYMEVSVIPIMSFLKKEKGILELAKALNELGKQTNEKNVKLLYHHHNYELIKFSDNLSFDILVSSTNKEMVNFVCDTYWLARSGYSPAEFISAKKDRIKGVHLRDNKLFYKFGKFKSIDTVIGNGTISFKAIMDKDSEWGIDFYSIEQDTKTPKKDIMTSYNYLKEL